MLPFILVLIFVAGLYFITLKFGKKEGLLAFTISALLLTAVYNIIGYRFDFIFDTGMGVDSILFTAFVVGFVSYFIKFGLKDSARLGFYSIIACFMNTIIDIIFAAFAQNSEATAIVLNNEPALASLITTIFVLASILGIALLLEKTKLQGWAKSLILIIIALLINFIIFNIAIALVYDIAIDLTLQVGIKALVGYAITAAVLYGLSFLTHNKNIE